MVLSRISANRLEIRHTAVKVSSGNMGSDKAVLFNNSHRRMALIKSLWSIRGNIWLTKMTISLADRPMSPGNGPLVPPSPSSSHVLLPYLYSGGSQPLISPHSTVYEPLNNRTSSHHLIIINAKREGKGQRSDK
jgi:hypothetical protein